MNISTAGVPIVLVALAGAAIFFSEPEPPSPLQIILPLCETALQDRLKSPTSYSRIKVKDLGARPATWEMYQGLDTESGRKYYEYLLAGTPGEKKLAAELRAIFDRMAAPSEWSAIIEYDASNSYGVPLRDNAVCSVIVDGAPTQKRTSAMNVRINGLSSFDWQMQRLK